MTLREKIEKMKRSDNPLLMDTASWNAAINAVLSLLDAEQPQPDCLPADKAEESATKLGFGVFESEAG